MKRGIVILLTVCVVLVLGYFTASKSAIRHETLTFDDPARNNRRVAVDVAVRRDKEMRANAGIIKLPVAILNHGNTVKFNEYSFLANVPAARGYLAISIQHHLDTDAPLVTKAGEPYVGRLPVYERGVANILFSSLDRVSAWIKLQIAGLPTERSALMRSIVSACKTWWAHQGRAWDPPIKGRMIL